MRDAATVLGIIRERGKRGLPLDRIYRHLYNPHLYLLAYSKLYTNTGAMTAGATVETVDGMALRKIDAIIADLRAERFRWTPARRIYIPKAKGRKALRPLGLPSWSDKLVQEVVRLLLDAYYEPQFSDRSHGFRPERSCHTALDEVRHSWTGTKWFIEGDIRGCFDNLNHEVLLNILAECIHDSRFLDLLRRLLAAGYLEDWSYHTTYSGTPQGGICSPILANIYLSKLDDFAEGLCHEMHRGRHRARNPQYWRLSAARFYARKTGRIGQAAAFRKEMQKLPAYDPLDPDYRRLHYLRYADDFLLGYVGTRSEADQIKERIGEFLREDLKLELSGEKTLVTHASTNAAHFLGYTIRVPYVEDYRYPGKSPRLRKKRTRIGHIMLGVPPEVVARKKAIYRRAGKPWRRPELLPLSDFAIVQRFGAEYRGIAQYYALAHNRSHYINQVHWMMQRSLLSTLANKHKSTCSAMWGRYSSKVRTPSGGLLSCLEVVLEREGKSPLIARFGGLSLARQEAVETVVDAEVVPTAWSGRTELVQRLLADRCELCGSTHQVEVHHIRKLADLHRPGQAEKPPWVRRMAAMRRKTLVVCKECHRAIHAGVKPSVTAKARSAERQHERALLESRVR